MIKNVQLDIERFDEGVTIRWDDIDGNVDGTKSIAVNGEEAEGIGELIWDDVHDIFQATNHENLRMTIKYELIV